MERAINGLTRNMRNEAAQNGFRNVLRLGFGALGEAGEEGISGLADPLLRSIYNNKTIRENWQDLNMNDVLYQMLLGGLSGGIFSSIGLANGQYRAKNLEMDLRNVGIDLSTPEGQAAASILSDFIEEAQSGEFNATEAPQSEEATPGQTETPPAAEMSQSEAPASPSVNEEFRPTPITQAVLNNGQQISPYPSGAYAVSYTQEDAATIRKDAKTFRNLIAGFDISVKDFFARWRNGRKAHLGEKLDKLYLGRITDAARTEISRLLGYDVTSTDYILTSDDVKHIMDEHGDPAKEIRQGNLPLTPEIIEMLPEVLANPDSIELGHKEERGSRLAVVFKKTLSSGQVVYIQFDNTGRGTIEGKTLYVKKGAATPGVNTEQAVNTFTSTTTGPATPIQGEGVSLTPASLIPQSSPSVNEESRPTPITQAVTGQPDSGAPTTVTSTVSEERTISPPPEGRLAADPGARFGFDGTTYSGQNEIRFQYAVVPLGSLTVSHDSNGIVNPAYPAELQPRDRSRGTSQQDIQRMAGRLNPALLGESSTAQNGAPIVTPDGVVVSGNGRTAAIRQAYGQPAGEAYRAYIRQHAAEFGIDPATIPEDPVLVRVADGNADFVQMARDLNASTTTSMSATETARVDAERLAPLLSSVPIDEDAEITDSANRAFVVRFIQDVVPESERGAMIDSRGELSKAGAARIQNAIFALAYGNEERLAKMAEYTDDTAKNITKALVAASQYAVQYQQSAQAGDSYAVDMTGEILQALELYEESRAAGQDFEEFMSQFRLFEVSDQAWQIAQFIAGHKRSGKAISQYFKAIYQAAMEAGDPNQTSFFGGFDNEPTAESILRDAERIWLAGGENNALGYDPAEQRERGAAAQTAETGGQDRGNAAVHPVPGRADGVTGRRGTTLLDELTATDTSGPIPAEGNPDPDATLDIRPAPNAEPGTPETLPSQTAETARDAAPTTPEVRSDINEEMERGGFRYIPLSNDEVTRRAPFSNLNKFTILP